MVCSFGSLFRDPKAPVEFLTMGKDFAKANLNHPDSSIPHPIAELFYFTSIATALVRWGKKITQLDSGSLRQCFKRLADQAWVDEQTRTVLTEGVILLDTYKVK